MSDLPLMKKADSPLMKKAKTKHKEHPIANVNNTSTLSNKINELEAMNLCAQYKSKRKSITKKLINTNNYLLLGALYGLHIHKRCSKKRLSYSDNVFYRGVWKIDSAIPKEVVHLIKYELNTKVTSSSQMYNYDILKDSFFSMVKRKVLYLKVPVVEIKLHCPILGSLIEKLVLSEFPRQEIISVFVLENNTDVTTWNECKYHFDYDDEQLSLINSRRYLPVDKLTAHMIIPLEHNPTLDFEGTVRTVGRPPKKVILWC